MPFKPEQTRLYLLCYAWQRYRQLTDNLVDALGYHMKQLEDESKAQANKHFVAEQLRRLHKKLPVMVVSALAPTAVAEDAWAIGAYTYITKPFELEAFAAAVKRGLRLDGHA